MSLHVNFEKAVDSTVTTGPPAVLVTEQFEVYGGTDISELLRQCSSQLQNRIENYESTGSGLGDKVKRELFNARLGVVFR